MALLNSSAGKCLIERLLDSDLISELVIRCCARGKNILPFRKKCFEK